MKRTLSLFLLGIIIFFSSSLSTHSALKAGDGKPLGNTPCKTKGYIYENGGYTYYFHYSYGSNVFKSSNGYPVSYTRCGERRISGSSGIFFGKQNEYLLTNKGLFKNGKGISYKNILFLFLSILSIICTYYLILYYFNRGIKVIKKSKILQFLMIIIFLAVLFALILIPDVLAGCAIRHIFHYGGQIINLVTLIFMFSSIYLSINNESSTSSFLKLKPPIFISILIIFAYGGWGILKAIDHQYYFLLVWAILYIVIFITYIYKHKNLISKASRKEKLAFFLVFVAFIINIVPRFETLCY